ncbi:hypothetical protein uvFWCGRAMDCOMC403_018 [Freshwater phage uvFW-CGR-AMD-COM-C403]|nr:hypothetical protein uvFWCGRAMDCOMC403_018 [Freshwater phage uvFW-CGR-AMD-COM-C403]
MARYLNPSLFMIDGMGDIPNLADALNTFTTVGNQVRGSKNRGFLNDAEFQAANNTYVDSAGENVPPPATATNTATVTATVTPTYSAEDISEIQRKISLGIALNDYELEILSAYQAAGNTISTGSNTGGNDNTGGDNTGGNGNNNAGPDGVDGFVTKNGILYDSNNTPYTGEWQGENYVDGKVVKTPGGDKYETTNGVFTKNGEPYTGTYQGTEYKDGKVVEAAGGDKYETVNGVFTKNGEPYTGTYGGQEYVDGKVKKAGGGDKYETINGVFTKNGEAYTGTYDGKNYKDGKVVNTTPAGETAENAALGAVTAQITALTDQIAALIKAQTDAAEKAALEEKKPKVVGVRTVRKTGGVVETVEVMSDGSAGKVIDSYKDYGARDSVMRMFQNLGLGTDLINSMVSAIDKVYEENIMPTEDQILNTIYTSDAYNTRFAANKTIRERMASGKGLPGDRVLTPQEYIQTEKTFKQYMESAGLPVDFYNELNDFTNLIANSVSADELKDRINIAKNVLQTADADAKKALKEYYGLTDADMVAYLLDKDKAFRAIDKRFVYSTPEAEKMYTASEVGGSALRAGMGATKAFAEEITTAGKAGQAEEAFQTTARNQQDYRRLMGLYDEKAGEEDLTRQQLSLKGGTEVALKTKKLASKERAKFQTRSAIDRASLTRRLNNPDV